MLKQQVGAKSLQINLAEFSGGLYIVHLAAQNAITVRKLVVEK